MNSLEVQNVSKCYLLGKPKAKSRWAWPAWMQRKLPRLFPAPPLKKRPPAEVWALRDISFAVEPGTILGVIGPNGAGKTTLLKVVGRVTLPTEGRVRGHGRVVSLLELGAGFQAELTGRDNVYLNAAMYGIPRSDVLKRMDEIVEFAELQDFIDVPVKRYSSGMYLRLAFSVAVNMKPDILLADEILAVGDLAFQERCMERVRQAGSAGMTVLFVSHDMAAITRLCDRVLRLSSGHLEDYGDPAAVVAAYEKSVWTDIGKRHKKGANTLEAGEWGEILSTRVLSSDGREIGVIRTSEEVVLTATIGVFTSGTAIRCAFDIFTGGVLAFRAIQPDEYPTREPGIYSVSIRIPPYLLAETIYSVNLSVTFCRDGQPFSAPLYRHDAFTIQVHHVDRAVFANNSYTTRGVVVAPRLDWSFAAELERDVVRA